MSSKYHLERDWSAPVRHSNPAVEIHNGRFAPYKLGIAAAIATVVLAAGSLFAQPTAPASASPPAGSLGAALYQTHCASCHDAAVERAPARSALASHTANYIEGVLRTGVMAPMAKDLDGPQIAAIAAYLAKPATAAPVAGASIVPEAPPCAGKPPPMTLTKADWNGWGASPDQQRFQPDPGLPAADAPRLKLKWAMAFGGGRNGQATVVGGRLFLTTETGTVYSLDAATGCAYWRFKADGGTRSSIIIGALPGTSAPTRYAAYFADTTHAAYAIDAETGALIWKTKVDDRPVAMMTGSLALYSGRLFIPISSGEEFFAQSETYECCKFRGAVAALDAVTGKPLWKTYTTTREALPFRRNAKGVQMYGPAGAAIWSAPTIDARRGLLYVGTGDSYTDISFDTADSIMALDLKTGAVRWSRQFATDDNFIMGCENGAKRANCPTKLGPDHDFGASPILHTLPGGRQLILAGQKSSQIYALDPDRQGATVWTQRISPGGPLGGVEFGMAADRETLYAPVADIFVAGGHPGLYAFHISDGKPLWSAPSLPAPCAWRTVFCDAALSQAISVTPGLVFAGAMNGRFRAHDSATGQVVWDYDTGVEVPTVSGKLAPGGVMDAAGPTIAGGMVFVVSGYQGRSGRPGSVLLAFSVDGR